MILVTGGGSYDGFNRIFGSSDSTEVLEDIAWTWRLTSTLPHSRDGLRAAVLDNNVNVFGENISHFFQLPDCYFIDMAQSIATIIH